MDQATMLKALSDGVRGGIVAPNEARQRLGYKPVEGGDSPYLQHQDYSLAALAKRDASPDPFAVAPPAAPTAVPATPPSPRSAPELRDLDLEELTHLVTLEANTQLRMLAA
jgi:phage portal protein BeeE